MKMCKFFTIMLILIPIALNAQIQVRLHQPPPNQLKIEHLWWVDLDNQAQMTYSVYLHAEITEIKKGLLFRGNSDTFNLPPGKKRIRPKDITDVKDVWYHTKYKDFIVRTGSVPEGDYKACIYVMNVQDNREIGKQCIHLIVRLPGPPRLISPKDGVTLKERAPLFIWTKPAPLPAGERVTYTLRIVEVLKGQTREEAIRSDPPWYEEKGIGRTSLRYPTRAKAFDRGKEYAWQIQAFDRSGYPLGENNGKSEIWQFKFVETIGKPLVTLLIPEKLSGKATIKADVRHTKGIDRVVFFLDGKPMFTDFSRPFEWILDTKSLDEGSHSFLAQGFDFRGNMGEDRHDRYVQYRFPMNLSPVRVRIVTPEIITPGARVEVYGDVTIEVEVTHNLDYGIKNITFRVVDEETGDVDTICERVYASGYYLDPIMKRTWIKTGYPEPPINTTCVWDAGVEWGSNYLIDVSAQDEYGNWGRASRLTTIARPRVPAIPQIRITRSVTRNGNCFEVTLTIENPRDVAIHDIHIEDESSGFQCIKTAWSQSMNSDGTWASSMARKESEVEYNVVSKSTTLSATFRYLEAGRSCRLRYYVVPILFSFDEGVSYIIGESTSFSYRVGDRNFSRDFDSQSHDASSGTSNVDLAFISADYLIVTNAAALFSYGYGRDDVNELLSTMAELAKQKNGVLGYISFPAYAHALKNLIRESPPGSWYEKLTPFDYLLLVGEDDIVPAWRIPCPGFFLDYTGGHIDISDYPYSNIAGDERPELKVGRIIGNTAEELIRPIQASLNVYEGIADYDGSDALLVTGYEDTWESNVKNAEGGRITLVGKGVTVPVVHTEYYTTKHSILAEALRIKGPDAGGAAFEPDPPMDTYTVRQLAVWLLDSEDILEIPSTVVTTTFTDSEGRTHPIPVGTAEWVWESLMEDALRRAEEIQAERPARGGTYGWTYTYRINYNEVLNNTAREVKSRTSNKDIIVFLGHGGSGSWACVLDDWTTSHCPIEPIDFGRSHPIVPSFSCYTGDYRGSESIARAFLRNGAAVYIGSTEVSGTGANEEVTRDLFWRSWSRISKIGDAFLDFRRGRIETGDDGWRYFVYEYNLYGDPKFGGR